MAVVARVQTSRNTGARTTRHSRRAPAAAGRTTSKSRRRRTARPRILRALTTICCAFALAFAFFYVAVYGNLTTRSHSLSELQKTLRQQQITNERLKIELEKKLSPRGIVSAAQTSGMIYATDYDYLQDTRSMAKAATDR